MARRRMARKSPVSLIVTTGLSVMVFATAVSIGVSLLKGVEDPAEIPSGSQQSSQSSASITPVLASNDASNGRKSASTIKSSSSEAESSSASVSSPSATTAASSTSSNSISTAATAASQAASSSAAAATGSTFDPNYMGASGKANIASYKKINEDVKGWLNIPGTNINYPVLQSPSNYDPHYYLDKNIYRNTDVNGVVYAGSTCYLDGGASSLSANTVLFGHNWTNYSAAPRIGNASDVMFAQLAAYHYLDFAKNHPYIWFSTEDAEMKWVIFSVFYTDISFNYIQPDPVEGIQYILDGAMSRGRYIFDVDVNSNDKILTLSTCTRAYGKSDKQRFVVMARLMRKGETVKEIGVTANPNPKLPNL